MKNEDRVCANTTSLPVDQALMKTTTSSGFSMDRREALKATACSVAMIAAPAAVLAGPNDGDSAILRLFRERCRLGDAIEHSAKNDPDATDETLDAELAVMRTVEAEIMRLPTTCAADFAAKVIVDTAEGGCLSEWETGALWKEARALTGCSV